MAKWLVGVLFLTSFLVGDEELPDIKVLCRKKDGNHIPVNGQPTRKISVAKRDTTTTKVTIASVEFRFPCTTEYRKECPGVDNMCAARNSPSTVDAHVRQFQGDPALTNEFCSLVNYNEIKCEATQTALGSQPMTQQEQCKGAPGPCPSSPTPPPPTTPAPPIIPYITPISPENPPPEPDWDEQAIAEIKGLREFEPLEGGAPDYGQRVQLMDANCYGHLRKYLHDCEIQVKTLSGGEKLCVAFRPRPKCEGKPPKDGEACEEVVDSMLDCSVICMGLPPRCVPETEVTKDGKILCIIDSLQSKHVGLLGSHQSKLTDQSKGKSQKDIAPLIYHPQEEAYKVKQVVLVLPVAARITEVNEKDQAISVMLVVYLTWTDHRLAWNPDDFGGINTLFMSRDSVWRPPITPLNLMSFSNDDAVKSNVKVQHTGIVSDTTVWNFRIAVNMKFKSFPFDTQTFYVSLKTFAGLKLKGTRYILTSTESESEWRIMEDFEKVPSGPDELTYKVVIKRYPYFWIYLIIVPCFILGFLVIAALTLGADSNSIENLVNIGLAASVASAVVVSTMTDNFPKTENVPSLATFVQNQFFIIVGVLVTLSIRKSIKPKIDAVLEAWQNPPNRQANLEQQTPLVNDGQLTKLLKKQETAAEQPMKTKVLIFVVKMAMHRLFAFIIFGSAYAACFGYMMRHTDLNFEKKQQENWLFTDAGIQHNFLSPHNGQ